MGIILSNIYEVSVLTTGLYGMTKDWHLRFANRLNKISEGRLESILQKTPRIVQPVAEIAPYALTLYTAMELGGRIARLF
ncbi:MAG: hypothetical protein AABX33_06075 [Nanoarchaeota archaeon]